MPGLISWFRKLFGEKEKVLPPEDSPGEVLLPQPSPAEPGLPAHLPETEMDAQPASIEAAIAQPPQQAASPATASAFSDAVVEQRARRAIEALLENESLTSDLDDAAAKTLLDWGIACARQVAAATAGLEDADADALMATRLSALRQMLRGVNHWAGGQEGAGTEADSQALQKILENAAVAYADRFTPPAAEQVQLILHEMVAANRPAEQAIASLRRSLDPHA